MVWRRCERVGGQGVHAVTVNTDRGIQDGPAVGAVGFAQKTHRGRSGNCEKIDDSQSCQMSNDCCAMSDELVKRLTDEMT